MSFRAVVILAAGLMLIAAGCTPTGGEPQVLVSFGGSAPDLEIGESLQLTASSSDVADVIAWSSSDVTIATVDTTGRVTALTSGTVNITAMGSHSGQGQTVGIVVNVPPPALTITLPSSTMLPAESTLTLSALSTAVGDTILWESSNTGIATVSASGVVTGVAIGPVTITARGSVSGLSDTLDLSITAALPRVTIENSGDVTLTEGSTLALVAGSTVSGDTFVWSSSNEAAATVNAAGLVTAIQAGETTITVMGALSSASDAILIAVAEPEPQLSITTPNPVVEIAQIFTLAAVSNVPNDAILWSSANEAIATVDEEGIATGQTEGATTITARGSLSGLAASTPILVETRDEPDETAVIVLSPPTLQLEPGSVGIFSASSSDPIDTFFWTSSAPEVATIDALGAVTGRSVGASTITVRGTESGVTAIGEVVVIEGQSNRLIFDGELPFGTEQVTRNTTSPFHGEGCLEIMPTAVAGPTLLLSPFPSFRIDISSFDEIWFFIKADRDGVDSDFTVRNFTKNKSSNTVLISDYIEGGQIDRQYRRVRIPIADLITVDYMLELVDGLRFGKALPNEGHRLFIDDVWAINLTAPNPDEAPFVGTLVSADFGDIPFGAAPVDLALPIENNGAAPLQVNGVSLTEQNGPGFSVDFTPFAVPAGGTGNVTFQFQPDAPGVKTALARLQFNNTPFGSFLNVPLRARAVAPDIQVSVNALDFRTVTVGSEVNWQFTVLNPGNQPLEVSRIDTATESILVTPDAFTLAPGETQAVMATFAPIAVANLQDTLVIRSNAAKAPEVFILVSGKSTNDGFESATTAVEQRDTTSSSTTLDWPLYTGATAVRVYLGPEPPSQPNQPLSAEVLLATLPGDATSYVAENLAANMHAFLRVEIDVPGGTYSGFCHAKTIGGPRAALETPVRAVFGYAPDVLSVVLDNSFVASFSTRSDTLDLGVDMLVGYEGEAWAAGPWTVTRADGSAIAVQNVYRRSVPVGQPYYSTGLKPDFRSHFCDVDHAIYLDLAEPVGNSEVLRIQGPTVLRDTGSYTLDILVPFSDKYIEAPSIQLNQVGYSPRATRRYAYISGWMGDGGPLPLGNFPTSAKMLIEPEDPAEARTVATASLPIAERAAMDVDSGGPVDDIDLSAVPPAENTVYRVQVPGVGVSWPTQINETAVFKSFFVSLRGVFYNRFGRDLRPEWTEFSPRPPDLTLLYTGDMNGLRAFYPQDQPLTGARPMSGGHHDAGDFDLQMVHYLLPMLLMRAYELNSEAYTDGQLILPESGNGIPDILDEALWNIRGWEFLQESDGGVRQGAESWRHPSGIYYADEEVLPFWTYGRESAHTMRCAGLFAQAATLIETFAPDRAALLRDRAVAAYDYAIANGIGPANGGGLFYGAGELLRLTGEQRYRDLFVESWNAVDKFGKGAFSFQGNSGRLIPWTSSFTLEGQQPVAVDYLQAYYLSGMALPEHVEVAVESFGDQAEATIEELETFHAHRNGRPASLPPTWAQGVAAGEYAMRAIADLQFRQLTPDQDQELFNVLSIAADYVLGCNPIGNVWLSGLGTQYPREPLHSDLLAFLADGKGLMPGIAIFGPTLNRGNASYYDYGGNCMYPEYGEHPLLRRYADIRTFVNTNEFDITVTARQAQILSVLVAPGLMPPDSWRPGGSEHRNTLAPRVSIVPSDQ
ncbi:MAG: Ig-like domain-containing protein [Candidatus Hydrogenedentes bacterium]|nr:Ig-like domain-containing protein [Candidatus Hydrogenedentota bacterium]